MATKPTIPASLRPLQAAAAHRMQLQTDGGSYDVDPDADPMGYTRLLIDSATRRNRADQATDDAGNAAMRGLGGDRSAIMGQFSRMQGDAARQGFAAPWQPFFESLNVLGENNPDKKVKTDTAAMAGIPMAANQLAPQPGLPPGYTDDRYAGELDTFAHGGRAPAFAESDTSGFPDITKRFHTEMTNRLAPGSLRALAKQGGY